MDGAVVNGRDLPTSPDGHGAAARIAIFLQDLAGGGAERMMLRLAEAFGDRGHPVDLVLVRASGPYLAQVPKAARVVELGSDRTLLSIRGLARYIDHARPAALLSALVHVNVAAVFANRLARHPTRLVVSERNTISIDRHAAGGLAVKLAHRAVPAAYRRADAIVAVSRGVARDLARYARLPNDRITVINNPVVMPRMAELAAEPLCHPWLQPGQAPVIVAAGRLTRQKDFPTLLRAFALVRRSRAVRLVILGSGEDRDALMAESERLGVRRHVDFPGFVANPYPWLARASAFALSSRWEGSPNVLVEAMACGTPVAATDCPSGPSEILAGGAFGPLVRVGDAEGLAAGLIGLLDRPPAAERLRRRAADYSVERSSAAYLDVLLNKALGGPAQRGAS